ncbi:hypothetical protein OIV83_001337 [Microbotryomycetes sp. JL201]|nr:hypothetical protein OIV83_001337 [Microbotryomycetes sp. JL201]
MPYAMPSPSTSPTATMTFPRSPEARPFRHHMRSHSSDAVPSTSSFIFVQPATPLVKDKKSQASAGPSPAPGRTLASEPESVTTEALDSSAVPRRQRIKIFGFTPAANDDGPSSQEESSATENSFSPSEDTTPRSLPFMAGRPPLVPVPGRKTASAQHINDLKDAFPARTTAMVRKKSGELVRSSLKSADSRRAKPRSAPATPISPKFVHFDTQLEHVKHFLAQQRPAAVSRTGSPIETETEDEPEAYPFPAMGTAGTIKLKLPNFPSRISHEQDVYVETLEMAPDGKSIRGVVRVRNLAFEKWVAVRFTLDHWQTVSEVSAEHLESMGSASDRFVFNIRLHDLLARIEEKTMFIAIRYTVGGREIWDNNDGQNYRVEFERAVVAAPVVGAPLTRQTAWSVTSAGRVSDRMADLKRELSRLVQDDDIGPPSPRKHDTSQWTEGSAAAFANRYDFGASFKQSGRSSANAPAFGRYATTPSFAAPSLVNGMPGTIYNEPTPKAAPKANNSLAPNGEGGSSDTSPVTRKVDLPPNFGDSYPQHRDYQASSPLYNPAPLYPPPSQHHQRHAHSPPEDQLKSLYQQYMTSHGDASRSARFNSFPGGNMQSMPGAMHYAPLLPPSFRDQRRRDSPFASPSGSPQYGSPSMSPAISPAMSPARSPESTSPPRARSPPLYRSLSPPPDAGGWSPASSEDAPSATSSIMSNETDATSVPDSPLQGGPLSRPSGPLEFSSFLDRYCYHTSSHPSSLGLVAVTETATPPMPITFASSMSDMGSSSASTTPRRATPLSSQASSSCGAYYASPPSSGASTPPHSTGTSQKERHALDRFATFSSQPAHQQQQQQQQQQQIVS